MPWSSQRILLSFSLLNAAMGIGVGLSKVVAPLYALSLGADEATLGMVAAAQSAGVLLLGMPTGFLVDRFGPSPLFVLGSLVGGALYLIVPLVPSASYLVLTSFALSCCMPLRFVPLATVFFEQLETLGEAKAGWSRGSHMGGSTVLGPLLAGALAGWLSYAQMYWVIAGLFLFTMTMARQLFQSFRGRRAASGEPLRTQLRVMFEDADLRGACLVDMIAMTVLGFFNFFAVVIAVKELGLSPERASGFVSAHGLCYVLVLFSAGPLVTRLGAQASCVLSGLAIAFGLLVLGNGRDALTMTLGAVVVGGGVGLLHIVNMLRFARIGARLGRGKIAGLNALTGPSGSIAASVMGGVLGSRLGLQNVFLCMVPLVGVLFWQLHAERSDSGAREAGAR
ncbi:MAG: MFS transporter [Polyangiales bacterium]